MLGPFASSGPGVNAIHAALPADYPHALIPGTRLTATQGTPLTGADVTAAGTLYLEPYLNNRLPVFDGSRIRWVNIPASKISLALTLSNATAYDVFGYWEADRVKLALSAAWSGATTRANALATLEQHYGSLKVNGVALAGGCGPYQGTWLGIIYASAANQISDADTHRGICNAYNAQPRRLFTCPGYTDDNAQSTWTTTSTTYTQANGGTGSRVTFLSLAGRPVDLTASTRSSNSTANARNAGVGLDTTTDSIIGTANENATAQRNVTGRLLVQTLAEGAHTADLMVVTGGGTATFTSDGPRLGAVADTFSTYLMGYCWG